MSGQLSLTHPRTISQRLALVFAASALALALGLGGCRTGARNSNGGAQTTQQSQSGVATGTLSTPTTGSTSGSTGNSNSAALQKLETIDSQNQSDSQQLTSAQSGAGVNYASQSSNTIP